MKMRLLCATDLTARSDRALSRTALLAQTLNAETTFVHAVSDSHAGRVLRMKVNRAKVHLMTQGERAMRQKPRDAQSIVRLGKPLQVISSVARELEPDLIIMAAPRRRRLDEVLGTTAERLTIATRRPVLVVSDKVDAPYARVVLASDLSETSGHAARTAAEMKMFEESSTWAVHAFDPSYPGWIAVDEHTERLIEREQRRVHQDVRRELRRQLGQAGLDSDRLHVSVQAAGPVDAIEEVIERVRPDLLVIGVSRWAVLKRMLIGSVANQLLQRIHCDILAIPPPRVRRNLLRAA